MACIVRYGTHSAGRGFRGMTVAGRTAATGCSSWFPAEVPKGLLAESLPSALVAALHAHNGTHTGPERIRLRMALHAGEVGYDEHGVTAVAVNLAFRLLDAGVLKAALASSQGVLAVIASSWFFEEVVRHSTADAAAYRPAEVAVKETTTTGWIVLPDHVDPAGQVKLEACRL